MKYIAKKEVVEAIQLGKDIEPELFWNFGAKRVEVCERDPFLVCIFFEDKNVYLQEREWLVKYRYGRVKTYSPAIFKREFDAYDEKAYMPYVDWRAYRELKKNAIEDLFTTGYCKLPKAFDKLAFENAASSYRDIRMNNTYRVYGDQWLTFRARQCGQTYAGKLEKERERVYFDRVMAANVALFYNKVDVVKGVDRIPFPSLIDEMLAYSRLSFESYQKIKNLQNKNMKQIPFDIERAKKGEGFFIKTAHGVNGYTLREMIKNKALCINKDGEASLYFLSDLEINFYHEVPVRYEVKVTMDTKAGAERCKKTFLNAFPFYSDDEITITEKAV